jgi:hypothetical protein
LSVPSYFTGIAVWDDRAVRRQALAWALWGMTARGEVLGTILDNHPEDSSYVMELAGGRLLDPAPPLRFVNHSCDPNCEIFYWEAEPGEAEEERLWMQTIRPIQPGEEILIDYCWPADAAIPCRCGALTCRGWIVDPAERHLIEEVEPT